MRKVKVKDGKGNVFEIKEEYLRGSKLTLDEGGKIINQTKINMDEKLANGYITLDDFQGKVIIICRI